jgi:hypothetical protein
MSDNRPLVLDLVEWVARRPRSYAEVMDAWRTSCPRLTVWEDALEQGLVRRRSDKGVPTSEAMVEATAAGRAALAAERGIGPEALAA